jgi:glycogen synthase
MPTGPLHLSVVINTYNRGPSLQRTLEALRYQTYPDFEVVAVHGPCTDDTPAVLAEFPDARTAACPEVHLSKSRNVGIHVAAGDVVAFIDDDAIPEPNWLADLAAAYDSGRVGGAGGLVYDHTGVALQYRYSVCNRLGEPDFEACPPFDEYLQPGGERFVYLQGTNASFRRACLTEVGGFNEEIEYYLDETEVCLRVIDRGYVLKPLDRAVVHHKFLASHVRNPKRVLSDPYAVIKNSCYFALLYGRRHRTTCEVLNYLNAKVATLRAEAQGHHARGWLTDAQLDHFHRRLDRGLEVGLERGLAGERRHAAIPPADAAQFRPFGTIRPEGRRLTVCFVSQEYPPHSFGGIGRYTADLAAGFAAVGHEVHVVTRSPDGDRVDFEAGVWMHRLTYPARTPPLACTAIAHHLDHIGAVYREVSRIHERGPLDIVSAPVWDCEGLFCLFDQRFPTLLTLVTSFQTLLEIHPSVAPSQHSKQLLALEQETVRAAQRLHGISGDVLVKACQQAGRGTDGGFVQPLGVHDRSGEYRRRRPEDGRVRVLFVGRLERRKGVDILLEAAERLAAEFPAAEFVLVGRDTLATESAETYRAAFQRRRPDLRERVLFTGEVGEDELYQHYADCDVFVLPSRYESFGLVLAEAMQFGKPVVASAVGGMLDLVEADGNGLLAPPGDAAALADALGRLLAEADLRARLGRRGRELFETKFSAEVMVQSASAAYAAIADQHTATADAGPVAERAAAVIAAATGLPAELARLTAAMLLLPETDKVEAEEVVAAPAPAPAPGRLTRLRRLVRRVPVLSQVGRYLKRLILLPRDFQLLRAAVNDLRAALAHNEVVLTYNRGLITAQQAEMWEELERELFSVREVIGREVEGLREPAERPGIDRRAA